MASSQALRWIDEINGVSGDDEKVVAIKAEIRRLRKEESSLQNRRQIKKLYEELDGIQFKPDYMCLIIDKKKDYYRAINGFMINGVRYHRLLGTNGGVKKETIVFVSDNVGPELRRRIANNRDLNKELVPAKFESYQGLTCSASTPVSIPRGILVVNDCETRFKSDIIYINDEEDGEPIMEFQSDVDVDLDESDGYGLMLPALADRWAEELHIDYRPSGVNTRFAWEKGMAFCFDFIDFAEKVAGTYTVTDAWGDEHDIRDIELILTTSMLKLWDSYESCDAYINSSIENGYQFGITKIAPKQLESERTLNYQFIQSYQLSDEDIDALIDPTVQEIKDVLGNDVRKTILFLCGSGLNSDNIDRVNNDYAKALMIEPLMINDPYVQKKVYSLIKGRITDAKIGGIKVHGNYSIVSGDPYSLCQSIFGLEVTGILDAGEIYNGYWASSNATQLACFRAPMTCHNNIRKVFIHRSDMASYWYKHMKTVTILNSWDTAAHALNGCDKDGDLVLLSDNEILVSRLQELPALMCVQRKANKKVITEQDLVKANIDSFGDDIGKITNRITSMFEIQARYPEDSQEYQMLDYRIKCGQLLQQNSIDKAKGIISKPMPRSWYDYHHAVKIEDPDSRNLYINILADKKPYFMRYIYPDLMRTYNTYIKNSSRKCFREFGFSLQDLLEKDSDSLTMEESQFRKYFEIRMPVGIGDCVMNRICRKIESIFDGYVTKYTSSHDFDYRIMKSGKEYSLSQYYAVSRSLEEYNRRIKDFDRFVERERISETDIYYLSEIIITEFKRQCEAACSNASTLCDILLDLCYTKSSSKSFAWSICGKEIIENLLERNNRVISYPTIDPNGDIYFGGNRFSCESKQLEVSDESNNS